MPFLVTVMLPDEELITVFVEVEGLLNSRPLNKVEDDVPLSPNNGGKFAQRVSIQRGSTYGRGDTRFKS